MSHPVVEARRADYSISTDPSRLDIDAIHKFLAHSYWCQNIPRDVVERSCRNSLCFGVYHGSHQVGLARVVTDSATFAYLCDVYILEDHRGHGLGKWLLDAVVAHPALQGLRRFILATRDAHGLYQQFGFEPLSDPARFLEIFRPTIYEDDRPTRN